MKQHTAQDAAQAPIHVLSRFGFPQEILTDQVSDFMFALMQIFLTDFGINQIRTSPYHPQTNGACERFNGKMKSMLHSLTERFQVRGTRPVTLSRMHVMTPPNYFGLLLFLIQFCTYDLCAAFVAGTTRKRLSTETNGRRGGKHKKTDIG